MRRLVIVLFLLYTFLVPSARGSESRTTPKNTHMAPFNSSDGSIQIKRKNGGKSYLKATLQFCTDIRQRECLNPKEIFSLAEGKIYCHSTIYGSPSYMEITHVWIHEGKRTQTVRLPVKSAQWRTWSIRTLTEGSAGSWKVQVFSGNLLIGEKEFTVKP